MTLFRRTAYFRLFLIFLICLLVLEGVLLCLLSWSRSVVKNELNASTAANVDYMSRKFEEDFEHIRYQLECATQSTQITHLFTYYQTMSPAERYVAVRDAMAYLDSLYLNSQSIGSCICMISRCSFACPPRRTTPSPLWISRRWRGC